MPSHYDLLGDMVVAEICWRAEQLPREYPPWSVEESELARRFRRQEVGVEALRSLDVRKARELFRQTCDTVYCRPMELWAGSGFPVVKVSPKFAAAAALTQLPDGQELHLPWSGFCIEVPPGIIFGHDGAPVSVTKIFVSGNSRKRYDWSFALGEQKYLCAWDPYKPDESFRGEGPSRSRVPPYYPDDDYGGAVPRVETEEQYHTTMTLLERIVRCAVLTMTNANALEQVDKKQHQAYAKRPKGRAFTEPVKRVFKLVSPVRVDLTEAVREYQLGSSKGRHLLVQSMVCGHWKHQPHGQGRSQRKWIWLHPYWRGPEDACIALRPHVLSAAR